MKEELAIHEDLCTSLELFNLATKCARAKEGCLSLLELPAADPKEKKPKAKDVKGLSCLQQNRTPREARISMSHPRAADTACTMTCTPTTSTNVKSSEPCE